MALGDVQRLVGRVLLTPATGLATGAAYKDEGPPDDARSPGHLPEELIALLKQLLGCRLIWYHINISDYSTIKSPVNAYRQGGMWLRAFGN
jgi:hypothetical protein